MKSKYVKIAFVLVLVLGIGWFMHDIDLNSNIFVSHAVTCGSIDRINSAGIHRFAYYNFKVNDEIIEGKLSYCSPELVARFLKGHSAVVVVYEPGRPKNSTILEDEDDFRTYSIKNEDTLGLPCLKY